MAADDALRETAPAPDAPRAFGRWSLIGYALAAVVIVADQISKQIMLDVFAPGPFSDACRRLRDGCGAIEVSGIFDLTMVWNRGVSFGLFQAESGIGRWALVIFSAVVAGLLAWLLRKTVRPFTALAFGLVIGGAIGNMIDRARFGAVVDFFDFSGLWFPYVFNVADAAISVGAALIVLELLLEKKTDKREGA